MRLVDARCGQTHPNALSRRCQESRCFWSPKSLRLRFLHSALLQLFWAPGDTNWLRHGTSRTWMIRNDTDAPCDLSSGVEEFVIVCHGHCAGPFRRLARFGTLIATDLTVKERQNSTMFLGPWWLKGLEIIQLLWLHRLSLPSHVPWMEVSHKVQDVMGQGHCLKYSGFGLFYFEGIFVSMVVWASVAYSFTK